MERIALSAKNIATLPDPLLSNTSFIVEKKKHFEWIYYLNFTFQYCFTVLAEADLVIKSATMESFITFTKTIHLLIYTLTDISLDLHL